MRIVVNTAFLPEIFSEDYILFLSSTFKFISAIKQEHHFIFICEKKDVSYFKFNDNTEIYQAASGKKNSWVLRYWYDVKIPALLRKYKADLFFSPGGLSSSFTKLPQCILINDPLFLYRPGLYTKKQLRYTDSRMGKSIQKATKIITLSMVTKNMITGKYAAPPVKVDTLYNGVHRIYKAQGDTGKNEIKHKYTDGKEYFFYIESFHPNGNLINLLKAFSLFKKRQQSNFQLVIYRNNINGDPAFATQLGKYKYRSDVKILTSKDEPEIDAMLSSAYAFVYPVITDDFCFSVTAAMEMSIPVITSLHSAMEEISDGAGLYVNPGDPQHIAESMMRMYKDERLRNELIIKGKAVSGKYTTADTAEKLWSSIVSSLD